MDQRNVQVLHHDGEYWIHFNRGYEDVHILHQPTLPIILELMITMWCVKGILPGDRT